MRILGQIPHPQLMISVFKSNNKFILKFDIGPFEQSYKFLESSEIDSLEAIQKIVTEEFIAKVFSVFDQMNESYRKLIQ